nr:retrovirus-related Pol polyprotein from transposon TNT 1-94 [Tanacetum cinerariifolium]
MHVVVWRNKPYLDSMSIDDLYNNLKVYEPEVKGVSSLSNNTQNMAFVSSSLKNNTNSSNEAANTAFGVTTADTQVNAANLTNIDNLSDAVICAFLASQSNSFQFVNEDLEQIHPDDLKEMDLNWQMAMLTMRARRFLKNTKRKLNLNGNESDNRNKESTRRNVPVETTNSSALVSCDGLGGYDWSDQTKDGPNYALMAYSTSSFDSKKNPVETFNAKTSEEVHKGNPQMDIQEKGVIDSGCSRHMTGNMSYLIDYKEIDRGYVAFGGNLKGRKITGKEAVSTTCYVQNRVLVVKPHNNTPYALFHGRTPMLSFMRSFGCPITILNTIDHLGKFDGKADEGFFIGYSLNSKEFRVFNSRTRIWEETLHIRFSENTPNNVGSRPNWMFDIDALTKTMNYQPVVTEPKSSQDAGLKPSNDVGKRVNEVPRQENECKDQEEKDSVNNTNIVNVVHLVVNAASN